ncbi:hypothetical protein GGTG_08444 [Gaeumannomyces tritici R3-111a-1]|uniref:Rhodopsin domain-containing protein n=1 Tax=Gaeumannomyces tritici (strain R3-111a-1) TaxID=644352 RepID=J3P4K7_GAET3|nr:hypothetical protein GGTG_08444 [Gaeumannomyces tritici R3-111a-1]EJT74604.1 hypothetical protein GGTG_08444 [Gaeumannomyces tritici R3-111a-1]
MNNTTASPAPPPGPPASLPVPTGPLPPASGILRGTPDYLGDRTVHLNIFMIAFSVIFVGLRLYSRLYVAKRPGLDDAISVLTLGALLALSAMDIRLVEHGTGAHMQFVPPIYYLGFFDALATQTLLYFWAVCLMRMQIVAFLPGIHPGNKPYKLMVWGLGAVIVVSTIVVFCLRIFSCRPISAFWLPPFMTAGQCMDGQTVDLILNVHSILGIVIDLCLVALPVWVIWDKMMLSTRKWRVLMVMSVGIFVVITGIVRYVLIRTTPFQPDATYSMATIGLWTVLEGHVGLWCGCFPAMQPVLRQLLASIGQSHLLTRIGYATGTRKGGGSKGGGTGIGGGGGKLSGSTGSSLGSALRNGKHGGAHRVSSDDDLAALGSQHGYRYGGRATAAAAGGVEEEFAMADLAGERRRAGAGGGGGRDGDLEDGGLRLPIMKSTTVELHFEEGHMPGMNAEGRRRNNSEGTWRER